MPLPTPLVVKNGSVARFSVASSMPMPVSRDGDADVVAGREALDAAALSALAARGNGETAAVRHGVARIQREIEDRELELVGIDADRREVVRGTPCSISMPGPSERRSISAMPSTRRGTSTASGRSSWRRAKASMRLVSVAPRSAPGSRRRPAPCSRSPVGQALQHEVEIAEDRHQHVVEIVRDAAGELAEALELLHLVHLRQRHLALARALLDAVLELGIGLGELRRALGDAALELGIQLLELAGLAVELGEDPHLGAQQLRHHRHRHIVDARPCS